MNVPMNDNERQRLSRSYLLPVEDTEFLLRDELRGIRFALEYSKAELLLREWGIRSTVIVFGSARTPWPNSARVSPTSTSRRAPSAAWSPSAAALSRTMGAPATT